MKKAKVLQLFCFCQYFGETGRNAFTRGMEHLSNKEADDENKSVLKLHANHHLNGRVDVDFTMKVTGLHTNSLDRQVTERVNIENFKGGVLMNRRNEMGGVRLERMQYRRGESVRERVGVEVSGWRQQWPSRL